MQASYPMIPAVAGGAVVDRFSLRGNYCDFRELEDLLISIAMVIIRHYLPRNMLIQEQGIDTMIICKLP